jgi:hypothetical protein
MDRAESRFETNGAAARIELDEIKAEFAGAV